MVKYSIIEEIINKSIEYNIGKCRKESYEKLSLSNNVKSAMNTFAEESKTYTVEHSVMIDQKGNVIYESVGEKDMVDVHIEEASKFITSQVEDLLKEFRDELDYNRDNNIPFNTGELFKKWGNKIADRINEENLQINLDHNHPSPYGENNMHYGSPIFTTLSADDMYLFYTNNVNLRIGNDKYGYFYFNNLISSMSCECTNGSRMSIVNKNKVTYNDDDENGVINQKQYGDAGTKLLTNWYEYKDRMEKGMQEYQQELITKYANYSGSDLEDKIRKDTNNYVRNKSKEEIPPIIKESIKDFKEIGIELRVDGL